MSSIKFVKAHACGNDFLVMEESVAQGRHAAMARKLCARHTGVGADGIEFLDRRADGTFFLRLFNADGSEAELSGNGTRCVAAWLAADEGVQQGDAGDAQWATTVPSSGAQGERVVDSERYGCATRDAAEDLNPRC